MAFTISVDLANKDDIFNINPENRNSISKKTISSKLLQDILGGEVDGLGYLKTTGDTISGRLIVTATPIENFNIANKLYVDSHTPLRKYRYECKLNPASIGELNVGTSILSGLDIFNNYLYFFQRGDISFNDIESYIDVFRDGILQSLGTDYFIINSFGGSGIQGVTAINFFEPFENGSTFQVNIGNIGAFPQTFGVRGLSGTLASRFYKKDGYINSKTLSSFFVSYLDVRDFAASYSEVESPSSSTRNKYVSPATLSSFPLMPRASGLFRKNPAYIPDFPPPKYGNSNGAFIPITSYKILSVISDPYNINEGQQIKVFLPPNLVNDSNYNCQVTIINPSFSIDNVVFNTINSRSKSVSSFEFFVFDFFNAPPEDIYEISVMVY